MNKNFKPTIEWLLNDSSFRNWAKNSNQNDITFWNTWIKNNPDCIDDIYTAKDIIIGITFKKDSIEKTKIDNELEHVLSRIDYKTKHTDKKAQRLKINFKQLTAFAAVGLILLYLGFSLYPPSKDVIHKTAYGEIINLKLPDGTIVTLNGNSEIKYNKDEPRQVSLKGEGYFKVKSIPSKKSKFWVNTSDLTVEVFGTQFNVNTRDQRTNVILDEGSINLLLKNGDSKKMVPGDFASFSNESNIVSHKKISESFSYASWKEDAYIFNNTKLEDVMKHVEHTYGVTSEFINMELKNKLISGGIPNINLDICLAAIQKAINVKIVKQNNKLLISTN